MAPGPNAADLAVVGIGASAGGLDALIALFRALDASFDGAVVVVQHLAAEHRSHLADILARNATLPVVEAVDGMPLQGGRIHVIAAGATLTVDATRLHSVRDDAPVGQRIDTFLTSLAIAHGPRAIAVVLSGAGADGAVGAARVREAGGRVFVQDPATALHDSMPRAAIVDDASSEILDPASIGRALPAAASGARPRAPQARPGASIADVASTILERTGVDLGGYQLSPLALRVGQRIARLALRDVATYLRFVRHDPHEVHLLIDGLPIHVTSFFRDRAAWDVLVDDVVAPLVASADPRPIRVWTPACASGEEAYSVAMAFLEADAATPGRRDVRVHGTDAVADIVAFASRGVYPSTALAGLGPARRARFFEPHGGSPATDEVRHALRRTLVFSQHDLLNDPPIAGCDLITCRNVLIYLDAQGRQRVVDTLHDALVPGGVLFLGASESPVAEVDGPRLRGFEVISRRARLYRRVDARSGGRVAPTAHDDATSPAVGATALAPLLRPHDAPAAPPTPLADADHQDAAACGEELQALRHELASVNARLSNANGRLADVDARLRDRVDELSTHGSPAPGGAMTICVDEALRLRWFTPAPGDLIPLRDGDAGRPITDLATRHVDADLVPALRRAIAHAESSDVELTTSAGRRVLRRVRPRDAGPGAAGAIVTYADVSALRRAQERLATSRRGFDGVLRVSSASVYRMSADWATTHRFETGEADDSRPAATHALFGALDPDDRPAIEAALGRAIAARQAFDVEHRVRSLAGTVRWQSSRAVPVLDGDGAVVEWFGEASDVTPRRTAEALLDGARSRAALLVRLRDALHPGDGSPVDRASIASAVAATLAAALDVARVDVVAADGDAAGLADDALSEVVRWIIERATRGPALRIDDIDAVAADDEGPLRDALRARGTRSLLAVAAASSSPVGPVVVVHGTVPRGWTADDVALVGGVAALAHDAFERATLSAALADSRERLVRALDAPSIKPAAAEPVAPRRSRGPAR